MNWKTIDNPLFLFEQDDEFAKFHFDFATKSPPSELFHYTTVDSFLTIINSKHMLATERSFLNDPQEFEWGLRAFNEHINAASAHQYSSGFIEQVRVALQDKAQDDLRLFVLSLSAKPDLLSQWRAYTGDGCGVAVGFSGSTLRDRAGFGEHVLRDINLDNMPKNFVYCYHLLPVIYEKKAQTELFMNFIHASYSFWAGAEDPSDVSFNELFKLVFRHRVKELLISFKSPSYKEESEWRVVATVHKNSEKIEYRNSQFGITPYVKLNLSHRDDLPNLKLPITTIWAGPNSPVKRNTLGLEMLFESKSINAQIKFSEINYRN